MQPGALQRLLPPWDSVSIEKQAPVQEGSRVQLRLGPGVRWVAEHRDIQEGSSFRDVQIHGPFASWEHTHRFIPADGGSILEDDVRFEIRGGWLGRKLAAKSVRTRLDRTFQFRHRRTYNDILRQQDHAEAPRLRIAITGASGLVGQHLVAFLRSAGHEVASLVRDRERLGPDRIYWNPSRGEIDRDALVDVDAVVHLAGESLFGLRWTEEKKTAIRTSRIDGTRLIAQTLATLPRRPRVLVSSSGAHYYGERHDEAADEQTPSGTGFLSEVCRQWEQAATPAKDAGVRVVHIRTGVVLSAAGGALKTMLPAFKMGLGGPFGDGRQYMAWIALDDLLAVMTTALMDTSMVGGINAVAPLPVTNEAFTRCLGSVLGRPTAFRLPQAIVRAGMGQMGDEMLLTSLNVVPKALRDAGFRWSFPDLEAALRFELGYLPAHREQPQALGAETRA